VLLLLPSPPQFAAIEKKQVSRMPMVSFLIGSVLRPSWRGGVSPSARNDDLF
jgi:hypothetical protein